MQMPEPDPADMHPTNLVLTFEKVDYTGVISSTVSKHNVTEVTKATAREISSLNHTPAPTVNNGAVAYFDGASVWTVTGLCYMTGLYLAEGAVIHDSLVTEGCEIYGHVTHSVIFSGVRIEEGAEVKDAVVMPGSVIKRGAVVQRTIVAENAVIGAGAIIGEETGNIAVIGHGITVPAGVSVSAGQQVDESTEF